MPVITLPHDWRPRDYQQAAWDAFERDYKRFCLIWHRRAGKDDFGLRATSVSAFRRVGNYWHMLPQASQARKAIWEAINPHTGKRRIDEAFPLEVRSATRETDMSIEFTSGSTWQVVGSDNFNSLVGSPPVGVIYSEYALADPASWNFLRPILAENGGWAMFITTPRGPNHAQKMFDAGKARQDWFTQLLTVEDTNAIPKDILKNELKEMIEEFGPEEGQAMYDQEYMCSFEAAILGSIYGPQMRQARQDGRIADVPYDPYLQVGTMWDLGVSDSTGIWFFQMSGEQIRFIDYFEANNAGFDFYARTLKEKGYNYDQNMMIFPHDLEARELTSGEPRKLTMYKLGITPTIVPSHSRWEGINLVRRNFHRFWFDATRCAEGIKHLALYQREYDSSLRIFKNNPKHDETSHCADALRIGCAMLPSSAPRGNVTKKSSDYFRGERKSTRPPSAMAM